MKKFYKYCFFALLSFFVIAPTFIMINSVASAQSGPEDNSLNNSANDNSLVTVFCNALRIVTGNGGKAFAAFAIISLGIGFFTGKVSWGLLIGVTMGVAAMFGAPTIVAAISGSSKYDCTSTTHS